MGALKSFYQLEVRKNLVYLLKYLARAVEFKVLLNDIQLLFELIVGQIIVTSPYRPCRANYTFKQLEFHPSGKIFGNKPFVVFESIVGDITVTSPYIYIYIYIHMGI